MRRFIDPDEIMKSASLKEEGVELPPLHLWHPEKVEDIDIKIARDGAWFHEGGEIKRIELARLFSTILRREDDGFYYLVTPQVKYRISVEDAPFIAVSVYKDNDRLIFVTNFGESVVLDDTHPFWVETRSNGEPAPYVNVRDNLDALVSRNAFYDLVELAEEKITGKIKTLIVRSCGKEFLVGEL
jgi:hypothetical protein